MIELSRAQDEEVGDGTTSVIILAGEVLSVVEGFLEKPAEKPVEQRFSYFVELLKNDADHFDQLVEISRLLSNENFELRKLVTLRSNALNSGKKVQSLQPDKITKDLNSIFA